MCGRWRDSPPDTIQHTMKKVLKFLAPFAVFSMGVAPAGDCSVADVVAMVAEEDASAGCTAISAPRPPHPCASGQCLELPVPWASRRLTTRA